MSSVPTIRLKTGQLMPLIGLGTYDSDKHDVALQQSVRSALECGYRSIDTAYMYRNEEVIGDELERWFSQGKLKRKDVFVTSKLPPYGNRPQDVDTFLTKSLKKLKLDYLDLYLIHHPFGFEYAESEDGVKLEANGDVVLVDTDLEAIWKAMEKEVESGRVRAIGLSNFNSKQIERILKVAKIRPTVHQIEIHVYLQQHPLVDFCRERDIAIVAYSPLGAPVTMGSNMPPPTMLENPTVLEIAKKNGKTPGQILLKYLTERDIVVIPKSVTPSRIKSNFDLFDFNLTKEEMERLTKLDRGESGRLCHFRDYYLGCTKHKEYPFFESF